MTSSLSLHLSRPETLFELLNLEPSPYSARHEREKYDDNAVREVIRRSPEDVRRKYLFDRWEWFWPRRHTHEKCYPLFPAIANGASRDVVAALCDACPDALHSTAGSQTPLHVACTYKAPLEVIHLLAEACPTLLSSKDFGGQTPLHVVARHRDASGCMPVDVVKYFVEKCPAALEEKDRDGYTPLHLAVHFGTSLEVVRILVEGRPAALDEKDDNDRTPIQLADSECVPQDVIDFLLSFS